MFWDSLEASNEFPQHSHFHGEIRKIFCGCPYLSAAMSNARANSVDLDKNAPN